MNDYDEEWKDIEALCVLLAQDDEVSALDIPERLKLRVLQVAARTLWEENENLRQKLRAQAEQPKVLRAELRALFRVNTGVEGGRVVIEPRIPEEAWVDAAPTVFQIIMGVDQ